MTDGNDLDTIDQCPERLKDGREVLAVAGQDWGKAYWENGEWIDSSWCPPVPFVGITHVLEIIPPTE